VSNVVRLYHRDPLRDMENTWRFLATIEIETLSAGWRGLIEEVHKLECCIARCDDALADLPSSTEKDRVLADVIAARAKLSSVLGECLTQIEFLAGQLSSGKEPVDANGAP
jgi:hypothetical protein